MKKVSEFLGHCVIGMSLSWGGAYWFVFMLKKELLSWNDEIRDIQDFLKFENELILLISLLFLVAYLCAFITYQKTVEKVIESKILWKKIFFFVANYVLWIGFYFFVFSWL